MFASEAPAKYIKAMCIIILFAYEYVVLLKL